MTDAKGTLPTPKRRRWLRVLVWLGAIAIVLLVAAWFVASSPAFFQRFVLPRAGRALNAEITVSAATIHPLREVVLRDLKVQAKDQEPVFTAAEVHARYSLWDILRGTLRVDEFKVASPVVQLVENADGSRNIDPILKALEKKAGEKPGPKKEPEKAEPAQVDLRKFTLDNATVREVTRGSNGRSNVTELVHVNITLENLKNRQSGKLTWSGDLKMEDHPAAGTNAVLQATLKGNFDFTLSADLNPSAVQGGAQLNVVRAEGVWSDLAALDSTLECDIAPTEVKQAALRFRKDGASLGELRASGPLDLAKMEGRLNVALLSLNQQVLNLLAAGTGMQFGPAAVNSTNEIQLANGGALITAAGNVDARKVQLTREGRTTPTMDWRCKYLVTVDRTGRNALLHDLDLTATQNGRALIKSELTSPMTVAWGGTTNDVSDSSLNLKVENFNPSEWQPFLGDHAPGASINLTLRLDSRQGGRQLAVNLDSQIANLVVDGLKPETGASPLDARIQMDALLAGKVADLRRLLITLTPTARGRNELQLVGRLDLTRTNAVEGNLKLSADSLDVTRYYDLFTANQPNSDKAPPAATNAATKSARADTNEPEAKQLPIRAFTLEADIREFYLREVAATNLQAVVKLDGNRATLAPFQFALNGGEVSGAGNLDLGVAGFRYDVVADTKQVPAAPLANSFLPEYRGRARGDLTAHLDLKGAGIRGASLQKNLAGRINMVFTNANIHLTGRRLRPVITVIAQALRVPEVADSPIDRLIADVQIGDGKINLTRFHAAGAAFAGSSQGTIPISRVLAESPLPNLPVQFSLSRAVAERAGFDISRMETNSSYLDLGVIAYVGGTLGNPKTKADTVRITLMTGERIVGGGAGQILRGIGDILSGARTATNSASTATNGPANRPATNPPSPNLNNLLDLLGPKKK